MKITNINQVQNLLQAVDKCSGDVFLKSNQGDIISLKSQLSRYIALAQLLRDHRNDLELFCENKSDEFFMLGFFAAFPETR